MAAVRLGYCLATSRTRSADMATKRFMRDFPFVSAGAPLEKTGLYKGCVKEDICCNKYFSFFCERERVMAGDASV
jgi:hypothetical protein